MLDPKRLRAEANDLAEQLAKKKFSLDTKLLSSLDAQRKELQLQTESLQNERKSRSKLIGQAKAKGEDASEILASMEAINAELEEKKAGLSQLQDELTDYVKGIPNAPDASVPAGADETANLEIARVGEPREFSFAVRDHADIGEALEQGLEFETGAKLTGARFVVMRGAVARLHRALAQFMLDQHTQVSGYEEVNVPFLVNKDSLEGTGQLPKFEEDLFKLQGEQEYYLIPTAEVPVTNIVRDSILEAKDLPLKLVSHTPCFRSEAGSYGRDTKGMIRQHPVSYTHLTLPTKRIV